MAITPERQKLLEGARDSLVRMQDFDASTLPRIKALGEQMSFTEAVEPAKRLIALYGQLPERALEYFPDTVLTKLVARASGDYNHFHCILSFDPAIENAGNLRETYIGNLKGAYDLTFGDLHESIAFAVRVTTDFTRLEDDARATIQAVRDEAARLKDEMAVSVTEAQAALKEVKAVAAEQGVTQMAIYFKEESDAHASGAKVWIIVTVGLAVLLASLAFGSLFLHKLEMLSPNSMYETVQLGVSKVLVFGILSYVLLLSGKCYLAHRHNAVVNKHRQNALQTYQTLTAAAGDQDKQGIVLTRAAKCIYSPQVTGFSRTSGHGTGGTMSIVEILSRAAAEQGTGG